MLSDSGIEQVELLASQVDQQLLTAGREGEECAGERFHSFTIFFDFFGQMTGNVVVNRVGVDRLRELVLENVLKQAP